MKKIDFKKILPHVFAVVLFLVVAVIFCKPTLEGKVLNQHDTIGWRGMAQQSFEVKDKTGHFPLWTNSMFSGMPAYQIAFDPHTQVSTTYIDKIISLGLPIPISFFFLAALCFYILCIVAGANPWVSMLGALGYAYATYNPIIVSVGHNTKMASLAYAPMIFAGLLLLFNKRYLIGFAFTALFSSIFISQNHLQIVYYTLLSAGIFVIAYLIKAIREKELLHAAKASALGLAAGLIGLATTAVTMLPTFEYAKESMRGGVSQLTIGEDSTGNKTKGGLDKDYALRWSFGKMETFTFMVPGLYGGSNGGNEHSADSKMVEKFAEIGVPEENALGALNGYSYWGSMSSLNETTSGPAYMGAIICFLFIFGLVYVKGWMKWWLAAASVLGILMAWGSNLQWFNYFLLDYFPYFSKFRAPSMATVIPQFCLPFLAVLALSKLTQTETDWVEAWKKFKLSAIITGAVLVFLGLFYFTADYTGKGDTDIKNGFKESFSRVPPGQQAPPNIEQQADDAAKGLMVALRADRKNETGSDLFRSLLLIALAAGLVGLFIKKKISSTVLYAGLIVLTCYDLISVDKRYMDYDKFKEPEEVEGNFTPTAADQQILNDPDHANVRVFNTTTSFTNESITSYHHNSIGGYNPAKLGLYQDLITHQIAKNNINVLNMLNTKYVIVSDQNGRPVAQVNQGAYGNCWLVKGIKFVDSPNAEMLALDSTDLRDTAVINNSYKEIIKQLPQADSSAYVKLKDRQNDMITYETNAATPQFAVFSEIYYSAGWNAYLDGQKTDYAKVNYVLRGMPVPAGKHTIEFKFEPKSFTVGRTLTIWSTILIYLLVIASAVIYFRRKK